MFPPKTNQSALIDESKHAKKIDLVILDGGFGTTLETLFSQDISGPLWSARLIDTSPKLVVLTIELINALTRLSLGQVTLARTQRQHAEGSDVGERCTRPVLDRAGWSASAGVPKIALSLGSFGATLPGGEEFGGNPPPIDPGSAEFYLERLRVFLPVLDSVDYVAFETVPLRREIRAIRRAMSAFLQEKRAAVDSNGDMGIVKWWISTVWPDGLYPEVNQNGERDTTAKDVVEALLGSREGEARPWGVGVNCTFVDHLPGCTRDGRCFADLEGATLSSQKDS
ncbi:hypothetical protein BC629DRAFT_1595532 [Irpex lacteus]|nr:hypothetical protein BC629DRAFT_1595532 [Irpex lacteus]